MSSCCDPCPWCESEIDVEEIVLGNDYAFAHWCSNPDCEWDSSEGRD